MTNTILNVHAYEKKHKTVIKLQNYGIIHVITYCLPVLTWFLFCCELFYLVYYDDMIIIYDDLTITMTCKGEQLGFFTVRIDSILISLETEKSQFFILSKNRKRSKFSGQFFMNSTLLHCGNSDLYSLYYNFICIHL